MKYMIYQSCLLDEIQSTNKIENIHSTRNDIFEILKDTKHIHNTKIISIVNSYKQLDKYKDLQFNSKFIRHIYDEMMKDAYQSKKDHPDGITFRKKQVYVTDGINNVHQGFYPEDKIEKGMHEFYELNHLDIDIYLKIIIAHFLIETIHPFYDGNGRLGRIIMSIQLKNTSDTLLAYVASTIINNHKSNYYKALEEGRDIHQFGNVNEYVLKMLELFIDGLHTTLDSLNDQLNQISSWSELDYIHTKSQKKIYEYLYMSTIFTYFGLSIEELMDFTSVSKRTLMSTLSILKEHNMLEIKKLGKTNYYKLNI